ncbi:uncharacterized protein N7483_011081 [Penicillium malachiteum]|uniref:uncharacterized protein n=1 Tax=Penicillium malachiteum TaxID=1324776 RepID=UPI0025496AD2|nr:uncharacterized protein N7483_011081 [Penicillium malachiteum]KAJ5713900.1 hypothetical protein N7483_011081 [Penicillium malachiteum]
MRPRLLKPGALPLLALIVFSLLTLVPSLPSIYNLKLADLTYFVHRAPQVPLLKDVVAEPPSAETHLGDPRTPWNPAAPSRSRLNRFTRSARLNNGAPTILSEIASDNTSRASHPAAESTFLFSRRARAFRSYFIQQFDDYQFLTPFSTRVSAGAVSPDPTLAPNLTSTPTALDITMPDTAFQTCNDSALLSTSSPSTPGLQLPLGEVWQQVCQRTINLWNLANEAPNSPLPHLVKWGTPYLQSIFLSDSEASDAPIILISHLNEPPSDQECSELSSASNKTHTPYDLTTDAAGRHSSELQGSCMAVVIGLVAGIIWF